MTTQYRLRPAPWTGAEFGQIFTVGIDWGPNGIFDVYRSGEIGIIKWMGHNAWTDNYSPWHWEATKYMLVRYSEDDQGRYFDVLKTIEPGTKWRSALKRLKREAHLLDVLDGRNDEAQDRS